MKAARKFHFSAGHRILGHESKCANIHGHNYVLWVYVRAPGLDKLGRVIDFGELKTLIDTWLQDQWDHTFLVYDKDEELLKLEPLIEKKKPWYHCSFNPSAENMAHHLAEKIIPSLLKDTGVFLSKLILYETENCAVEINCPET